MKLLIVLAVLTSSSLSFAGVNECQSFIENNFDKLNVCMQGTYASCKKGDNSCLLEIRNCRSESMQTYTCDVEQTLPSSKCVMEVTLNEYCNMPLSSVVKIDGREL